MVYGNFPDPGRLLTRLYETPRRLLDVQLNIARFAQLLGLGVLSYTADFMLPYWTALRSFQRLEKEKLHRTFLLQTLLDYLELSQFNLQIAERGLLGSLEHFREFRGREAARAASAVMGSLLAIEGAGLTTYTEELVRMADKVINEYPRAIEDIAGEYGFHFEDGGYIKVAETERFLLYQVLSRNPTLECRQDSKPILIMHPYVLGPNILAFLPEERKSYVHAFADQGIPTYIRILKDIGETPAVQVMTGEDDARDTAVFCRLLKTIHGREVTVNGFCQGGFIAVLDILSGELDGLVDALITCVAPMDGTRSRSLVEYMEHLPPRFRDMNYAVKVLPNGNRVVDGKVMSWVYKLKSIDREAPLVSLFRDLALIGAREEGINKTAAALIHWLIYDRTDLPEAITKLSFDSYTIPVTPDGTLPVRLFGRPLNFKGIQERGIKWLLCWAEGDDLVDRDAALVPLDYLQDIEVTAFPKGHGSIATSWSHPDSAWAIHKEFSSGVRGPVKFQMDLDEQGR